MKLHLLLLSNLVWARPQSAMDKGSIKEHSVWLTVLLPPLGWPPSSFLSPVRCPRPSVVHLADQVRYLSWRPSRDAHARQNADSGVSASAPSYPLKVFEALWRQKWFLSCFFFSSQTFLNNSCFCVKYTNSCLSSVSFSGKPSLVGKELEFSHPMS